MNDMLVTSIGKKKTAFRVTALLIFLLSITSWEGLATVMAQEATPTATAVAGGEAAVADDEGPNIDIWYGSPQVFGQHGTVQEWVNILGNVSDPDGISTLVFSLNGGRERPLSVGPDGNRLTNEGDFNAEIWRGEMQEGTNEIAITATDTLSNLAYKKVTIEHHSGNMWPFPYEIVWNELSNIQDVAQVVDGKWEIGPDGLRTAEIGSNRLVAIGDLVWQDYEVVVPVTIRRVQKENDDGKAPALGLIMRWNGHIDNESGDAEQPRAAWAKGTTIAWWHWQKTTKLEFDHNEQTPFNPRVGVPYLFKVRAETMPDERTQYRAKAWIESQPEPEEWNVTYLAKAATARSGSLAFLARHVDVLFGNVMVTGLAPLPTPTPLPSSTPTITLTPTASSTPTPSNTPTITLTPTASATATVIAVADAADTAGDDRSPTPANQGPTAFSDSPQMYGMAFGLLALVLVGLAFVRRQLMS
ncbi:MAG: hypothetical protein GWP61_09895 [Chloroflexi bacterium]|jgi:hypothetical protein|nr:hypothetical protein [Chloroflexota bacterium]